ncbi:hypothetical protein [Novosphingobium kaempferiae]|uniref:hypothetical protein n=1 Tax=Novosphingobium kaempferiae TaxID=2896849 RepID=UPI001E4C3FDC|nr:hypothetical protein [Novosphingobium kaempferiae]
MAARSIAVEYDVSTQVGQPSSPYDGYDPGGMWSQVSLVVSTRAACTVNGQRAAWKAVAKFSYTGTKGGSSSSTSIPVEVTLTGSSTALTVDGQPLLRDGDSKSDRFGNTIRVSASGPLRSE